MPVLIQRKDISNGAVSPQGRSFDQIDGKTRAARVFMYFPTADLLTAMPHSLNRVPTSFRVVMLNAAAGAPVVYSVTPPQFSKNYIALKCSVANSWAEIEIS